VAQPLRIIIAENKTINADSVNILDLFCFISYTPVSVIYKYYAFHPLSSWSEEQASYTGYLRLGAAIIIS